MNYHSVSSVFEQFFNRRVTFFLKGISKNRISNLFNTSSGVLGQNLIKIASAVSEKMGSRSSELSHEDKVAEPLKEKEL